MCKILNGCSLKHVARLRLKLPDSDGTALRDGQSLCKVSKRNQYVSLSSLNMLFSKQLKEGGKFTVANFITKKPKMNYVTQPKDLLFDFGKINSNDVARRDHSWYLVKKS